MEKFIWHLPDILINIIYIISILTFAIVHTKQIIGCFQKLLKQKNVKIFNKKLNGHQIIASHYPVHFGKSQPSFALSMDC